MSEFAMWELAVRGARVVARGAAPFNARVRRGVRARDESPGLLGRWAARYRDRARPLFWLHAPSVGEALMAQAIVSRLREAVPECQVAYTWFSLSAERMVERVGADVTACLPWEVGADVRRALDALAPAVLGFVRTEIWPVLLREATKREVRTALVNAPLGQGSRRLRPLARRALASAYAQLDAVGAVSAADAERLTLLGARAERISVTGDARVDQILSRLEHVEGGERLHPALGAPGDAVIVAGSTWPADEERLLPAWASLRADAGVAPRLIIAPHEPTDAHLNRLESAAAAAGIRSVRLSAVEAGTPVADLVVVDRVGILADLYRLAAVAWVGGGFGTTGLHSVLEPAAFGVPVVFGPRFGHAREAAELVAAGGGFVAKDAASIAERARLLLRQGRAAGRAARDYVESRRGGAARNAELLVSLLRPPATVHAGD